MSDVDRSKVSMYQVATDRDGQRIDNLLIAMLKGVPRSWVYRVIRKGQVRINGKRCKASQKVAEGDQIRIPPVRTADRGDVVVPDRVVDELRQRIVFSDPDYLVIDKPPGLAVHGGSGLPWGVIDALRQITELGSLELVHRLDRETSGCLLLARHRVALLAAQEQWQANLVAKRYLCLMKGRVADKLPVVAAIRKNVVRSGERMVQVDEETGKRAVTTFSRLEGNADWSFCEADIETGRTHQIRVHAQHVGHPLAGDERYGDAGFNHRLRGFKLRRLFLHCTEMGFETVKAGRLIVHSPLSDDLRKVLDELQSGEKTHSNSS